MSDNAIQNCAMESVGLMFMIILYIACMLKKRKTQTTEVLTRYVIYEIGLLICQIFQWVLESRYEYQFVYRLLFVVEYMIIYLIFTGLFQYITCYIKRKSQQKKISFMVPGWMDKLMLPWGIFIFIVYIILYYNNQLVRFWQNGEEQYSRLYIIMGIMVLLYVFFDLYFLFWARKLIGRIKTVLLYACNIIPIIMIILDVRYNTCFAYLTFGLIALVFYISIDIAQGEEILEQQLVISQQDKALVMKKSEIMLSQIQPHFMFNSLSVISSLCLIDSQEAKEAVDRFSHYLRMNMESLQNENVIDFEKELDHTKSYLWLEKKRFADDLQVEYHIDYTSFRLPPLTLQPMVENAVRHGICKSEEGGTVVVSTCYRENEVWITVEDNGIGFDIIQKDSEGRMHVGIQNVRERLMLLCQGQIEIESEVGKGTKVIMRIPHEDFTQQ